MRRILALFLLLAAVRAVSAEIVIAEGEQFKPLDAKGWKVTHQDDSYASHTYGGMWVTHGGLLGAPADSVDSTAVQTVSIPKAGAYRVWSKYQAPPYFNYLHRVEIVQNGKTVYSHVYGRKGTPRLWSFSGESDELWWPWGVDHDAAEAPKTLVNLAAGTAELRLVTTANEKPAGDRRVDFVVLTTEPGDTYQGFKPYQVGTPFANEALAATRLYARFRHDAPMPQQLSASRSGHFQPQYGGATQKFPEAAVAPGQWSAWFNVGPFCRLVHDEGLKLTVPGSKTIEIQFARDEAGADGVGNVKVADGETVVVPIDVTWRKGAVVRSSREHAESLVALIREKKWRTANGGKKPKQILYFGAFSGSEPWVSNLKDALGYNTLLPDQYDHVRRDGLHAHAGNAAQIQQLAARLTEKDRFRVLSFGDEIHLGEINYADPQLQTKFRDWLKARGVSPMDLGTPLDQATLTKSGNSRLAWYSNLFNEEERFGAYRELTQLAKKEIGPHVLTGANYSPHTLALYYGPIYQWVDIFKHNGMSMFWAEDYIFSVPETPQILSWMFATMRCATKYNGQPIHFYVMPHAPGQEPGFLRRNLVFSVGAGARHIDTFWVAPAERFTENYVNWHYPETFRTLHESIYDSAEAETLQSTGKVRPGRVAVVLSKATDFNESRLMFDKAQDAFAKDCANAPAKLNQILCRKDQQMLYLALRQAQHGVDLITEDDIADGALKNYEVVYFAGEWIDTRAVQKFDEWVNAGGVLYTCAGCGRFNQFGEPEPAMRKLLGLKDSTVQKNTVILRTLLELPQLPALDTLTLDGEKIAAVGLKQVLTPDDAKVVGVWSDGSAAVTVREHGKGKAFAVGTLAGNAWMKTALRVQPWARGGRHTLYNPEKFDSAATKLVRLGVEAKKPTQDVVCDHPGVEAVLMDGPAGTLLTLVNWTNAPLPAVKVKVRLTAAPKSVRSVQQQKELPSSFAEGVLEITTPLTEADYLLLPR